MINTLNYEYIRGLACGYGCFTFCSAGPKDKKVILPAFILSMGGENENLMRLVTDTLGLQNRVYKYPPRQAKNRKNKQSTAMLIVRDFGQLKNIIVPLFHKKLTGSKSRQFESWIEKMGKDPRIPQSYKFIYKLYKNGYYGRNAKYDT